MGNLLIYAALGLAAITTVTTFLFFMSRTKLQEKVRALEEKLLLEQARRTESSFSSNLPKKKDEAPKASQDKNKHVAELIELRKISTHQKDEIKQLKAELRKSESQNKDFQQKVENETFKIRAENQALIERLKELDSHSPDKKRAAAIEHELNKLKTNFKDLQTELNATQAKLKSERASADKQRQSFESLQRQWLELKARHVEESQESANATKIDPKVLQRWKERALTARQMYQMMRQMRELSDLKLSTYQDAVIEVSESLLKLKGADSPNIGPRENKADRYLAEAWSLLHPDTSANP